MKRFMIALAALVSSSVLLAATPLPPAPAQGYCYDSQTTAGYNGVRACAVQPPPPEAAGRILTSNISYVPATGAVRFTSVTEWSAVLGHATPVDAESPFPGKSNAQPAILNFKRTGYLALHFRPTAVSPKFGWVTHTEYNYGADLTWAISTVPGDFNPSNALCKGALPGETVGRWTTVPATYRTFCPVTVGANYYLNVKLTNPAAGTTTCAASASQCVIGFANAFGG